MELRKNYKTKIDNKINELINMHLNFVYGGYTEENLSERKTY